MSDCRLTTASGSLFSRFPRTTRPFVIDFLLMQAAAGRAALLLIASQKLATALVCTKPS